MKDESFTRNFVLTAQSLLVVARMEVMMAVSRILHMKEPKQGFRAKHLANALRYIMKPEKTEEGRFVSGHNCLPDLSLKQMLDTKRRFNKMDKRQGYHIIISFEELYDTVDKDTAYKIVEEFVQEYLGDDFEAVYTLHTDTEHIHGHIVFNSVRCSTGLKYDYKKGDWERYIQPLVNELCEKYKMGTLDLDEVRKNRKKKQEREWDQNRDGEFIWNDMIKRDIDEAVSLAEDLEGVLEVLQDFGYEVKQGAHIAIRPPGMKPFRRMDSLKGEYTQERIRLRVMQVPPMPQLPPELEEEELLEELKRSYLPKAKLNGYQKAYVARLFRIGLLKKRPYSKVWMYKDEIKEFQRLQEEYNFLSSYGIEHANDLERVLNVLEGETEKIKREKEEIEKSRQLYEQVLVLYGELEELKIEESLYQEGYAEFMDEHTQYMELQKKLNALGYRDTQAEALSSYYGKKVKEAEKRLKENWRQLRLGRKIKTERGVRMQEKTREKGKGKSHEK